MKKLLWMGVGFTWVFLFGVRGSVAQQPVGGEPGDAGKVRAFGEFSKKAGARKSPHCLEVVHRPPFVVAGGISFQLELSLRGEWLAKQIWLYMRIVGQRNFRKVLFRRWRKGWYVAILPKEDVTEPGFEYFIVSIDLKGRRHLHFGSAAVPHRVLVRGKSSTSEWLAKLARHQGNRSSFGAGFSFMSYGDHAPLTSTEASPKGLREEHDYYYNVEVWYTYRILGFFYDITFGWGHMRGVVPIDYGQNNRLLAGLDYGFSNITMEFHRYFSIVGRVVLGASDRGFDGGGGATLRIGNMMETHLDLGFEVLTRLGYTLFFELAWDTVPGFLMALRAEVTNMPFFDDRALAAKAFVKVLWKAHKHFHVFANVGYGRRRNVPWGGLIGQGGLLFHF